MKKLQKILEGAKIHFLLKSSACLHFLSVSLKHLRKLGVNQSFSNPGTPLDNAVAESFFACMKREELSHNCYDNLEDLRHDVSNYIDFFNNTHPPQRFGMQTPSVMETQFVAEKTKGEFGNFNRNYPNTPSILNGGADGSRTHGLHDANVSL